MSFVDEPVCQFRMIEKKKAFSSKSLNSILNIVTPGSFIQSSKTLRTSTQASLNGSNQSLIKVYKERKPRKVVSFSTLEVIDYEPKKSIFLKEKKNTEKVQKNTEEVHCGCAIF